MQQAELFHCTNVTLLLPNSGLHGSCTWHYSEECLNWFTVMLPCIVEAESMTLLYNFLWNSYLLNTRAIIISMQFDSWVVHKYKV